MDNKTLKADKFITDIVRLEQLQILHAKLVDLLPQGYKLDGSIRIRKDSFSVTLADGTIEVKNSYRT